MPISNKEAQGIFLELILIHSLKLRFRLPQYILQFPSQEITFLVSDMRIWDICFWLSSGCKSIIDWLKGRFSDNRVFEAFWFFSYISNILNFTFFFAILKIRDWKALKALKHGSFSCKRKESAVTLGDNEFRTITNNSLGKFLFKTTEKASTFLLHHDESHFRF